ncbi:PDZ domain-containing protein [Chitinophaga vietnamensis]|uniref:PDZ domain-containing protein n=1 Tax=Chitinophaga vietnamensis TaxID=2593957 RepID=UPI0011776C58|nr:PDZ domain-containing protein [Chitinophaga vietnamensis]
MSKLLQTLTLAGFTCFSFYSASVSAQDKKDKLGEFDEIVIKHKSDKDGKVTVEIKNGEMLLDGKKPDQFSNPDISVFRRKITPVDGNTLGFNGGGNFRDFNLFNDEDDNGDTGEDQPIFTNKAVLGVITEKKAPAGATVKSVAKGSPAEKAGIKAGDIITNIDNKKIDEPRDLFETIGNYQPGDKITVTYIRNKKDNKVNVTLDERKEAITGNDVRPFPSPRGFNKRFYMMPPLHDNGNDNSWSFGNRSPLGGARLGLQVQDTENGDGAKVINIAEGSAAEKAGFKQDDIITELAGTPIKSAHDVATTYRNNINKNTITVKVTRNGQQQTIEVKVPKQLNKVDL